MPSEDMTAISAKVRTDEKALFEQLCETEGLTPSKAIRSFIRDCNSRGDKLHTGFFFTLSQMLALKHEVRMLSGEAITRKEFDTSWRKTRRELGI